MANETLSFYILATPANVTSIFVKADTVKQNLNCDSQPCLHGGTCTDGLDKFFCACVPAYTGNTCSLGKQYGTL